MRKKKIEKFLIQQIKEMIYLYLTIVLDLVPKSLMFLIEQDDKPINISGLFR